MKRVAIVGGGIAGLAAAHALRKRGEDVVVLERSPEPGGNLKSERREGYLLEWGPHSLLDDSPDLRSLIGDLGLADQVVRADASSRLRFILRDGRLRQLPASPLGILTSDVLPVAPRARLLAEPLVPRKTTATDESVHDLIRRRLGPEAATILADSLVAGIYAGDSKTLSAAACFPRLVALEREHGSLLTGAIKNRSALKRGAPFSLAEGIAELPKALAASLGARVRTAIGATSVTRSDHAWHVATTTSERITADRLILACPAWDAAKLLAAADPTLARLLAGIPSVPVAVVHLGFRAEDLSEPPKGFGFLVPSNEGSSLLGMIAASNVFPSHAPEGQTLVTAMMGGARAPRLLDRNDADLIHDALAAIGPILRPRTAPGLTRVIRHPRAIPQYTLGHLDRLAAIDARRRELGDLDLIGNSYRGVSVGAAVEDALKLA